MFFFRKMTKPKPAPESLDLRHLRDYADAVRERQLQKDVRAICTEWFPDNEQNTWRILRMHHDGGRSYAEMEPDPKDVGYEKFVFMFEFGQGDTGYRPLAVWCFERGGYYLLSTAPECNETPPRKLLW